MTVLAARSESMARTGAARHVRIAGMVEIFMKIKVWVFLVAKLGFVIGAGFVEGLDG